MTNKRYDDVAYYDFDRNYADAVDLIRQVFGEERADRVLKEKGKSQRTDFNTAITWGWMMHRPLLNMQERAICVIGNLTAKLFEKPLRDYIQLGLAVGLHREKIREAIFTLAVYGGVPATEWGLAVVDSVCDELDAHGWQPFTPPGPLHGGEPHNHYDFIENYLAGVEATARRTGRGINDTREERLARTGASSNGDFNAVHWGWMMQRPIVTPKERYLFLVGADSANKGYLALKDHTSWILSLGVPREHVQEAIFLMYMYNGWPANREANNAVTEVLAELDKKAAEEAQAAPSR